MILLRPCRTAPAILSLVLAAATVSAAAPDIKNVSLRGLQIGGQTTLVIEGSGLLPPPRLLAEFEIREQQMHEGAADDRVAFDVVLDESVLPGIYALRAANAHGVSNAVVVGVDRLPQMAFVDEMPTLPAAMSGEVVGESVVRTRFHGVAGQRIVVDVEAQRLNSRLSPAVHLLDSKGVQIAWSQMERAIAGDARLHAQLPADGEYAIELHDALFRGRRPGFFRLKVGELEFTDLVYPFAVERGGRSEVELLDGGSDEIIEVAHLDTSAREAPLSVNKTWATGGRPAVLVTDLPEMLETEAAGELAWPAAVNGRLAAPGERDRYSIAVAPGQKLRIAVTAARANSPLDGVLVVSDPQGNELARADDADDSTDPALDFDPPAGIDKVFVEVSELLGRGGDAFVYRLSVDAADRPAYSLSLEEDRVQIPRDGTALLHVAAQRRGYDGPIALALPHLPAGVRVDGAEIPAGSAAALVTFTAGPVDPAALLTHVDGRANGTDSRVQSLRQARSSSTTAAEHQPWLAEELAVAVTEAAPLAVEWTPASGDDAVLPRAGTSPLAVTIRRATGADGPVRLSLLTTQVVPKKEVDGKQVEDVNRALRLDGEATIAAGQSSAGLSLVVPADLPQAPFDVALRGELLTPDGKETGVVAYSAARRMSPVSPIVVHLINPSIHAESGGPPTNIRGYVERRGALSDAITLSIEGLPADLASPVVEIPAEQSEFSLPLETPVNYPVGPLDALRVVARGASDVVRAEAPLSLKIAAGAPPPALLRVFEDEGVFAARLSEGEGHVLLDTVDRFSGAASLRVTNGAKLRRDLPGLGVAVREQPGDGEYRYLRFAWKCDGDAALELFARRGVDTGNAQSVMRYAAGSLEAPAEVATVALAAAPAATWVVVTRDLFADFGECRLEGLGLTAPTGAVQLDHMYLARTPGDLAACPTPLAVELPLVAFEDDPATDDEAAMTLDSAAAYSGAAAVRVAAGGRTVAAPKLNVRIRRDPAPGEHRYLQFAWRKQGGERIAVELGHDGRYGPDAEGATAYRYDAGPAKDAALGAALRINGELPADWEVVTRDLYADFGEFTLTGIALNGIDGEAAWLDHAVLGRSPRDFDLAAPRNRAGEE